MFRPFRAAQLIPARLELAGGGQGLVDVAFLRLAAAAENGFRIEGHTDHVPTAGNGLT